MNDNLLEKLAQLGINLLPEAGQTAGAALGSFGGPVGSVAGGMAGHALGAGLGGFLQSPGSPYEGGYMLPQQGGGISQIQGAPTRMENAMGAIGQSLGSQATSKGLDALGSKIGAKMGMPQKEEAPKGIDDKWMALLQKVMQLPREDIEKWLESRA